jgi:hypothetical protein
VSCPADYCGSPAQLIGAPTRLGSMPLPGHMRDEAHAHINRPHRRCLLIHASMHASAAAALQAPALPPSGILPQPSPGFGHTLGQGGSPCLHSWPCRAPPLSPTFQMRSPHGVQHPALPRAGVCVSLQPQGNPASVAPPVAVGLAAPCLTRPTPGERLCSLWHLQFQNPLPVPLCRVMHHSSCGHCAGMPSFPHSEQCAEAGITPWHTA